MLFKKNKLDCYTNKLENMNKLYTRLMKYLNKNMMGILVFRYFDI